MILKLGSQTIAPIVTAGRNLQIKSATPSTIQQEITPDTGSGYNGLSKVVVDAVTAAIDSHISAGNIRSGVTILGITGTYGGGSATLSSLTVNPSTSSVTYTPDTGYDGYNMFTVNAVSYITYYTGSSTPSAGLGNNDDIYLQTS